MDRVENQIGEAFSLHGTILEPVRNRSKIGPAFLQMQFWIRSGPVPEWSHVSISRSGPVRFGTVHVSEENRKKD